MSKNIVLSTLALTAAVLLVGVPLTACSAEKKLSEAEACRMATESLKKDDLKRFGDPSVINAKVSGCTKFTSISERGVAQINVSYSFYHVQYKMVLTDKHNTYYFIRTDQGWKIDHHDFNVVE